MNDWAVYLELELQSKGPGTAREKFDNTGSEALGTVPIEKAVSEYLDRPATVSYVRRSHRIAVRCVVKTPHWGEAQNEVVTKVVEAMRRSFPIRVHIAVVQVTTADYDPIPELMGTSEVAQMLEVTPQRVRQLMFRDDFPSPAERLRMGPVFLLREVAEFRLRWNRTPARRIRSGRRRRSLEPLPTRSLRNT